MRTLKKISKTVTRPNYPITQLLNKFRDIAKIYNTQKWLTHDCE